MKRTLFNLVLILFAALSFLSVSTSETAERGGASKEVKKKAPEAIEKVEAKRKILKQGILPPSKARTKAAKESSTLERPAPDKILEEGRYTPVNVPPGEKKDS